MGNARNIAFWVVLFLLILALFNLFSGGQTTMSSRALAYSDFLSQVDKGEVARARSARLLVERIVARASPDPVIVLGDFNVAPEDRDSYDPEGLRETIHHTSAERRQFRELLELGLSDSYRMFEQPPKSYSWWDYRMLGFQKNRGLRIDHILISDALKARTTACEIDRAPRKNPQPSDHAPVVLTLD